MSRQLPDVGGLTVNERLITAGLLGAFDAAVKAGDRARAIELLMQVSMSESSAINTVETVLANPLQYGFLRPF